MMDQILSLSKFHDSGYHRIVQQNPDRPRRSPFELRLFRTIKVHLARTQWHPPALASLTIYYNLKQQTIKNLSHARVILQKRLLEMENWSRRKRRQNRKISSPSRPMRAQNKVKRTQNEGYFFSWVSGTSNDNPVIQWNGSAQPHSCIHLAKGLFRPLNSTSNISNVLRKRNFTPLHVSISSCHDLA